MDSIIHLFQHVKTSRLKYRGSNIRDNTEIILPGSSTFDFYFCVQSLFSHVHNGVYRQHSEAEISIFGGILGAEVDLQGSYDTGENKLISV